MKENKDEILRKIKERVISIGYDFFHKGEQSRVHEQVLHLGGQSKDADNSELLFEVAIGSSYFRVTFGGEDKPKKCGNLDEMLDYIEDYLVTRLTLRK